MEQVDLMQQMLADGETDTLTNDELSELAALATQQLKLEADIAEGNNILAVLAERLRKIQEVAIPDLMASIGMKKFTLANGYTLTIKEDVFASMRADFIPQAVKWLDDHELGGIVKDDVIVKFGRGDAELAKKLMAFCESNQFNAAEKLSVHPMTLKATVREQLAKGVEFPTEFFSTGPIKKAIIKAK